LPHCRLCTAPHLDDLDQRLTPASVQCLTLTTLTNALPPPLYSTLPHHDDLDRQLCIAPHHLTLSTHHHLTSATNMFSYFSSIFFLFSFYFCFF
jgi:hypothetical protein